MKKFLITVIAGYLCVAAFVGVSMLMKGRPAGTSPSGESSSARDDQKGMESGYAGTSSGEVPGRRISDVSGAPLANRAFKTFYRDGRLSSNWIYKEGLLTGQCILYAEGGQDLVEFPFSRGRLQGSVKTMEASGLLQELMPFEQGRMNGILQWFYPSGKVWMEWKFDNGVPAGPPLIYSENGAREFSGDEKVAENLESDTLVILRTFYADGRESGLWPVRAGRLWGQARILDSGGRLMREIPWENGQVEGAVKSYDENGLLRQETAYHAGLLHGTSRWYYPDGNLWLEMSYENGSPAGVPRAYSQGKPGEGTGTEAR